MNFIVLVLLIFYKSVKNCYEEYKVLYFIIFLFLFDFKKIDMFDKLLGDEYL